MKIQKAINITLARHTPTGEIIHIKSAENGLSCNCVCVQCGERLEAIQGEVRVWHFRHNTDKNCPGGRETALHQFAKQIIKRNNKIRLQKDTVFEYQTAVLEQYRGECRPDVLISNTTMEMVIEIAVKHFVEKSTEDYYIENQIQAIEIDLSKIDRSINEDQLEQILINEFELKRVIYPVIKQHIDFGSKLCGWGLVVLGIIGLYILKNIFRRKRFRGAK